MVIFWLINLLNERILFPLRWGYLVEKLSPYLKDSNKILDLGASCGGLANELSKNLPKADFIGIDVHIQPKTFIQVKNMMVRKFLFQIIHLTVL